VLLPWSMCAMIEKFRMKGCGILIASSVTPRAASPYTLGEHMCR
jgi:hypothetical protein